MQRRFGPFFWGIMFLALGVVWLLNNLGLTAIAIGDIIATYWPVVLLIWGLEALLPPQRSLITGGTLLALGALILGRNLELWAADLSLLWKVFWPLIIIAFGWSLLRGAVAPGPSHWAVMSGIDLKNRTWNLEGGDYLALMGGIDMDLTTAVIPEGETNLNLTAIMSGRSATARLFSAGSPFSTKKAGASSPPATTPAPAAPLPAAGSAFTAPPSCVVWRLSSYE